MPIVFGNRGGAACLAFEDPEVLEVKVMLISVHFKTDANDHGRGFCHLRCFKKVPRVTHLCPHKRFWVLTEGSGAPEPFQ